MQTLVLSRKDSDMSENIFAKRDQKSKEEHERLGLGDLDAITAMSINSTAIGIINEKNITDESEKLQVYQDVRRQKLEYQEQRRKEIEAKYEAERDERLKTLSDKLEEDSKITRLEAKVQSLDERLAKLEKYTQEYPNTQKKRTASKEAVLFVWLF